MLPLFSHAGIKTTLNKYNKRFLLIDGRRWRSYNNQQRIFSKTSLFSSAMDSTGTVSTQQRTPSTTKWAPGSITRTDLDSNTSTPLTALEYRRGQQIKVRVTRFGPMGASVVVLDDEGRTGLILQREIAMFRDRRDGQEVIVGEELDAFVEKVREDEKLDLALRPQDMSRISTVKQMVLDALEGSPSNIIPIGDKSFPDDVAAYFHGISKRDFKNAVGSLYKDGLVQPGEYQTQLIPEDKRASVKAATDKDGSKSKPYRSAKDRVSAHTIFVGNFPVSTTVPLLEKTIQKLLGKGTIVETRLAVDESGQAKGFAFVEFVNATVVADAVKLLKGKDLMGRKLRVDFANESQRISSKVESDVGDKPKPWRRITESTSSDDQLPQEAFNLDSLNLAVRKTPGFAAASDITFKAKKQKSSAHRYDIENLMDDEVEDEDDEDTSRVGTPMAPPKRWSQDAQQQIRTQSRIRTDIRAKTNKPSTEMGPRFESTLYVGNLPFQATEDNLKATIESYVGVGAIARVRLVTDRESGRSKGFAYVDVFQRDVADRICDEMQDIEFMGRKLNIDEAKR